MSNELIGAAGIWLWEKYGKEFVDEMRGEIRRIWTHYEWSKNFKQYERRLSERYGTIRVLGKAKPMKLEGVFTDVFVLDRPTALTKHSIENLPKEFVSAYVGPYNRINGVQLIRDPESMRLFVLGKPGAGKTTFMKYLVQQCVSGKIERIPIFVNLKEWADEGKEITDYIIEQFEVCSFPDASWFIEYILQKGRALVLFDGLDEVKQEKNLRNNITEQVRKFSEKYILTQVVVTCRIAATDYTLEKFWYVEIADFTDEQMKEFVEKWFIDDPQKGKDFMTGFNAPQNRGLRELGSIPLLLTLLCLNFEETLTFPSRRVELYEESISALLSKWDASRNIHRDEIYRDLSLGRKRQMFARIAAETFEKSEYFVPQARLE